MKAVALGLCLGREEGRKGQEGFYDGYNQTGTIAHNEILVPEETEDRKHLEESPTLRQCVFLFSFDHI